VTPEQALRAARVIALALLVSGAVVAVAGTIVTLPEAGATPPDPGASLFFWLWVAVAIGATAGWWVLWRSAAGLSGAPPVRSGPLDPARLSGRPAPAMALPRLVAAYALLEAQLMVAFAASLVGRTPMLLVPSLTLFALGILLSFPRREWFAPTR
jgi:hypothetical protein